MDQLQVKEIGKTRSFFELFATETLKVEIPKIQRDYAQGRVSAFEIRNTFLQTLKRHLDEGVSLNLDFVYGSIENKKFIPIDGQQRLTTLFLLHWYLAWSCGKLDHLKTYLQKGSSSNFTYDTRTSSREFCDNLLSKVITTQNGFTISAILKDQYWYYLNWKNDPTITGMLNTLDTIEDVFDNPSKYYNLLTNASEPLITFQFIELKDFGLSDQLYIKMNSRGKPLTEFENLKANIENIFEKYDHESGKNETRWFTSKIDGEWVDFFWGFVVSDPSVLDVSVMNFIRISLTNYYAVNENVQEAVIKKLLDSNLTFNFFLIKNSGLGKVDVFKNIFLQLDKLIRFKDQTNEKVLNDYLIDLNSLFSEVIKNQISYPNRVLFYALVEFLVRNENVSGIVEWMRIIRNLTENSRIEIAQEYVEAIKTVDRLLGESQDILSFLVKAENKAFTGFSSYQVTEEIFKAGLMIAIPEWKLRIEKNENHPYLNGHIGFLFSFSGVEINLDESHETRFAKYNWDLVSKTFDHYSETFFKFFNGKGLNLFPDFLFERALLTQGDYLLSKGRNYSFLIDSDRDIGWKRLLRDDKNRILKSLFDQIGISEIQTGLKTLVSNFTEKGDWRYFFIKYPDILYQTGRYKFIRWKAENDILLLEKTQTNGTHREYYSYAILCELKEIGYTVAYHPESYDEDGTKYISSINGKEISIYYLPSGEYSGYWVEFNGKEIQFATHEEVVDFVIANI